MRYLVSGIRRSGNHTIIEWIMSHGRKGVLYNNVTSKFRNRPSETLVYLFDAMGHYLTRTRRTPEPWEEFDTAIVSLEDRPHENFQFFNKFHPDINVTILRSFWNVVASRQKGMTKKVGGRTHPSLMRWGDEITNLWITHARSALRGDLVILYDRWLDDYSYRCHIAHRLGFRVDRSVPKHEAKFFGGSSFGGIGQTTTRCLKWEFHESWFKNTKVSELNRKLFGWYMTENSEMLMNDGTVVTP